MAKGYSGVMRLMRLQQLSAGIWPLKEVDGVGSRAYGVFSKMISCLYTMKIVSEFANVCNHADNLFVKGEMLIVFSLGLEYQIRLMYVTLRPEPFVEMLVAFRDEVYLCNSVKLNHFDKQIVVETQRQTRMLAAFFVASYACGYVFFYSVAPAGCYLRGGTPFVLPFELALPFDTRYDGFNYALVFLAEVVLGYAGTSTLICHDVAFCVMVAHLVAHCRILCRNITALPAIGERKAYRKLEECVAHHQFIVGFAKKMQNFFGFIFFVSFLNDAVFMCLVGFQLTAQSLESILKFGFVLAASLLRLVAVCVYGDMMTRMGENICKCIYFSNWLSLPKKCKKAIFLFLMSCQRPITFSAMGFSVVSLKTMASILKTSFSYFTLLRSMAES